MHGDGPASDTHPESGPLGRDPEVRSTARGLLGGECASVTFDRRGRIVTVCTTALRMQLLVLDATTFHELAQYDLPPRPSMRSLSIRTITTDTSGGAYFYLDEADRAVVGTAAHRIEVVGHDDAGFHLERAYDLASVVAPRRTGRRARDGAARLERALVLVHHALRDGRHRRARRAAGSPPVSSRASGSRTRSRSDPTAPSSSPITRSTPSSPTGRPARRRSCWRGESTIAAFGGSSGSSSRARARRRRSSATNGSRSPTTPSRE